MISSISISNLFLSSVYVDMKNRDRIRDYKTHYFLGLFKGSFWGEGGAGEVKLIPHQSKTR